MAQLHELIQPSCRIRAIGRHRWNNSLYDTAIRLCLRQRRTVAVQESALTALKLRISVGSKGLITDISMGFCVREETSASTSRRLESSNIFSGFSALTSLSHIMGSIITSESQESKSSR